MPWLWPPFVVQPKPVTSERGEKKIILVVTALEDWEWEEAGVNAVGKKKAKSANKDSNASQNINHINQKQKITLHFGKNS